MSHKFILSSGQSMIFIVTTTPEGKYIYIYIYMSCSEAKKFQMEKIQWRLLLFMKHDQAFIIFK
jgi:hypothetical protein